MWKRLFWLYAAFPPGTLPRWLVVRILSARIRPPTQAELSSLKCVKTFAADKFRPT